MSPRVRRAVAWVPRWAGYLLPVRLPSPSVSGDVTPGSGETLSQSAFGLVTSRPLPFGIPRLCSSCVFRLVSQSLVSPLRFGASCCPHTALLPLLFPSAGVRRTQGPTLWSQNPQAAPLPAHPAGPLTISPRPVSQCRRPSALLICHPISDFQERRAQNFLLSSKMV